MEGNWVGHCYLVPIFDIKQERTCLEHLAVASQHKQRNIVVTDIILVAHNFIYKDKFVYYIYT